MKIVCFLTSIILAFSSYSQTLEKFYGFRFGTTVDSVKKGMLSKPGCKIDPESSKDLLIFSGVNFAGRDVLIICFAFVNNKLHTGSVYISPRLESGILDLYNQIRTELNEKYYFSTEFYESYKYPYEKEDGHTITAIKLGKAKFSTYWKFKNPKSESEEDQNLISLRITENLSVKIIYQDGVLINEAVDQQKKENYKDY